MHEADNGRSWYLSPWFETVHACRFSQSALRKMYRVLLGHMEPPDDVVPDFIREELSGVGNSAQQSMARGRFLKVSPHNVPTLALSYVHQLAELINFCCMEH